MTSLDPKLAWRQYVATQRQQVRHVADREAEQLADLGRVLVAPDAVGGDVLEHVCGFFGMAVDETAAQPPCDFRGGARLHVRPSGPRASRTLTQTRSAFDRRACPSSVLAGVSGASGSVLWRRWSSTQTSASPAEKR